MIMNNNPFYLRIEHISQKLYAFLISLLFITSLLIVSNGYTEVVYEENFESGWGDWYAENGVWEIGMPQINNLTAFSLPNCAGTVLNGNYPNTTSRLISESIELPTIDENTLLILYLMQYYSYSSYDEGIIQIRSYINKTKTWTSWKTLETINGKDLYWYQLKIDLTSYAGNRIQLGFLHKSTYSSYSNREIGWYIDNIQIIKERIVYFKGKEDFEAGWTGWFVDHGVWEFGEPLNNSYDGYCVGTLINGQTSKNSSSNLISPRIQLPNVQPDEFIFLKFWHYFSYSSSDYGKVYLQEFKNNTWYPNKVSLSSDFVQSSTVWSPTRLDLTQYQGKTIRLVFSHNSQSGSRWYIDNIEISTGCITPPDPNCIPENNDLIKLRTYFDQSRNDIESSMSHESTSWMSSSFIAAYLFANVLPIRGEASDHTQASFLSLWQFAKEKMARNKIKRIFNPLTKQWETLPDALQDHLLVNQYIAEMNQNEAPSIPVSNHDAWNDATQVITKDNILIAYSLFLAYLRGWGEDLIEDVRQLIKDIRTKCIIQFNPGQLYRADVIKHPKNMFSGYFMNGDQSGRLGELNDEIDALGWMGTQNFVGFNFNHPIDLSQLDRIEIEMKGHISPNDSIQIRLQDNEAVINDINQPGHVVISPNLELASEYQSLTLSKYQFIKNDNYGTQLGDFNWSSISKMLIQVNHDNTSTENSTLTETTTVYLKSIKFHLSDGQVHDTIGYQVLSSANGELQINPSSFMPFALRVFSQIDPQGANIWNDLIDMTYNSLDASLHFSFFDDNVEEITGNGSLIPDGYMLDWLTGQRIQSYDKNSSISGYDAYQTIWFIVYDYWMNNDSRARRLLESIYPFFRKEFDLYEGLYSEHLIDGTFPDNNQPADAGFHAVFLDLFSIIGDDKHANKLIPLIENMKHVSNDGQMVWFENQNDSDDLKKQFFITYWAYLGSYFYEQMHCIKGGDISGYITTTFAGHEKIDVTNAQVTIKGSSYQTTTDQNGYFEFVNLSPGYYELEISAPHLMTLSKQIYVDSSQKQILDIPTQLSLECLIGDITLDGKLSLKDAIYILNKLVEIEE